MQKRTVFSLALLFVASVAVHARAQSAKTNNLTTGSPTPKVELQMNYNYFRVQVVGSNTTSAQGGNITAAFNIDRHWSLLGDFSGVTKKSVLNVPENVTLYNYGFGPRYSMRNHSRFTPYVQGLAGVSVISSNYPLYVNNPASFGATVGGGLNMSFSQHLGLTLGEADWVYSRLPNGASNEQSHLRVAAGLQIRFGSLQKHVELPPPPPPPAPVSVSGPTQAELNQARSDAEQARQALAASQAAQARAETDAANARAEAAASRQSARQSRDDTAILRAKLRDQLNTVLPTRESSRGLIVDLSDVHFDTGQAVLHPGSQNGLKRLAATLQNYPGVTLQIEGYTDSVGGDAYNQTLSEARASAVKTFLISNGVADSAISARGYGKANPVATNATAEGRAQNRRVDLVVSGSSIGLRTGDPTMQ